MQKQNDEKKTVILLRLSVVLVFLIGLAIIVYWLPFCLLKDFRTSNSAIYIARLIFYWLCSIPIFCTLCVGMKIIDHVKEGSVFSYGTSNCFKIASKMIFFDCVVFLTGQCILSFLSWIDFDLMFFIVGICGLIVALVAYLISGYVMTASEIKEENDSIL